MVLFLLVVCLWLLTIYTYYFLFKKDLSTPCIYFVLSFAVASTILFVFSDTLAAEIHFNTASFILCSCIAVVLGSLLLKKDQKIKLTNVIPIKVSCIGLLIILALQFIDAYVTVTMLFDHYGRVSLSENLFAHTLATKGFSKETPMTYPKFLGAKKVIKYYLTIVMAFYSALYLLNFKKFKICFCLCFFNFILLLLFSLLTSGRLQLLVGLIVFAFYYLVLCQAQNKSILKPVIISIVVLTSFAVSFKFLGETVGRSYLKNQHFTQSIIGYCGAEIQGLDNYLNSGLNFESNLPLGLSFNNSAIYLNRFFGVFKSELADCKEKINKLQYFDESQNKRGIGNVKTALYAYLIDFGYVGTMLFCFVIGVIIQYVRNLTIKSFVYNYSLSYKLIILGNIVFAVSFSFFFDQFCIVLTDFFTHTFWLCYFLIILLLTRNISRLTFRL